ncbi:MAG: PQQ-dependent sugar dehydrogenase [Bacteroidia bacterium]
MKNSFYIIIALVFLSLNCKRNITEQFEPEKKEIKLPPVEIELDTLLTGLNQPWGIEFLPDRRILIAEKSGSILLVNGTSRTPLTGLPIVRASGQGGLMDIKLHPNYKLNGWIYFSATVDAPTGFSTALFRAKLNNNNLESVQKIFQSNQHVTSGVHFGSRIVFDKLNKVYLCLGERNATTLSQSLLSHAGKVVRLNDDGTIPEDNPYFNTAGALKDIYTYGHRNPQGMVIHPTTQKIWLHEHGPMGGDEINLLEPGANYGWPLATFGINYDGTIITNDTAYEATLQPIYYWKPSIAPCGMDFYFSDTIPQWKGNLFIGALAGRHLNMIELNGEKVSKETRMLQNFGRFRCVKQGPDGYLYFSTESPGLLCRFKPKR